MPSAAAAGAGGWTRVAIGLRMVARAAAQQATIDAGSAATRATQHGAEILTSLQKVGSTSSGASSATTSSSSNTFAQPSDRPGSTIKANGWTPTSAVPHEPAADRQDGAGSSPLSSLSADEQIDQYDYSKEREEGKEPSTKSATTTTTTTSNLNLAAENQIRTATASESSSSASAAAAAAAAEMTMGEVEEDYGYERLREGKPVPSTRIGRAAGFASLGLGLAFGTAAEGFSRLFTRGQQGQGGGGGGGGESSSLVVNEANSDRLAAALCRMRGAALKMGQMLSIQDESLLPPALTRALQQVRKGADAMPQHQLLGQLEAQLGKDWRSKFVDFDMQPFAAASIGQVHRASILKNSGTGDSDEVQDVVVKVQYPGVGNSIESDLRNLSMLVTWTGLAPKGLFIENVIRVGQKELKVECDYQREMVNQKRIKQLVESDPVLRDNRFVVPDVVDELTSDEIITSEYMPGGTIDKVMHLKQDERDRIGRTIMYLTMRELFDWRFMQTDPNWGNFLYDVSTRTTSLIDFGATSEYGKHFVDGYLRIVWASANLDERTLMDQSRRMKFLTGEENDAMLRAHKLSGFTLGEPFRSDEPFDFRRSNISTRMGEHTSVFLRHRLTPPPEEVYTLHRKLAGAYMLCIKLGAVIRCRDMLEEIVRHHQFTDGMDPPQL